MSVISSLIETGELLIQSAVLLSTFLFFFYLWRMRGMPPGPWGLPLVGYLPWIDRKKPHLSFMELYQEYGGICSIRMGEVVAVVLSEPAYVKEALSKEELSGRAPLWLTHGLMKNQGILAVEGPKWREQRKFTVNSLKNLGAVKVGEKRMLMENRILRSVRATLEMIEEKRADGPFDPKRIFVHTIGNLMNEIVFGVTFDYDDETWKWLQHLAEEGARTFGVAGPLNFMPYLRILPQYQKLLDFLKTGQKKTHDFYRSLVKKQRSKDNTLDHFLEAMEKGKGKYFNDEQMVYLLADMFGAGIDSTLATFRWVVLYLALNPQVQEKIYEEVIGVVGKENEPTMEQLPMCPFTEATILEAMRIRTVVPLGIPHGAMKETQVAGFRIPKGAMIIINQWTLHHDPKYWDDPESFQPERFISPDGTVKRKESFNPFQNGKRACIGEEFARMVLFFYTCSLVKRYSIQVEGRALSALEGEPGITMSPAEQPLTFLLRP